MEFKVTGFTKENHEEVSLEDQQAMNVFCGKNAGICYMPDTYEKIDTEDVEKSSKRFFSTINNGHHSIADHVQITVVLSGISKMLAMILNSLQYYATSEKSGRYTIMTGNSEKETNLYNKWKKICYDVLIDSIKDEKKAEKVANENARYFLSIFTRSTTMAYTTSYRQWCYIYRWAWRLINDINDATASYFDSELKKDLIWLMSEIEKSGIDASDFINDYKYRRFDFLGKQTNSLAYQLFDDNSLEDKFDYSYQTTYDASFVQLAQAQRHRTIKYEMFFDGYSKEFFVPKFIEAHNSLHLEWIEDMETVKDLIPQATKVKVFESGNLPAFLLKCEERLCYRAQIEICKQTQYTLERYYNLAPDRIKDILFNSEAITDYSTGTKCSILKGCKEPCGHKSETFLRLY